MWPGNFLPFWVDCYADDSDPAGFSFAVNTTHPRCALRGQRWRCQRARVGEMPAIIVPPNEFGQ
eukprot:10049341-Lingulodinium_polyedra.AAC.1